MNSIVLAILLAVGGTLAATFYTLVVGLAGAPGALLSVAGSRRRTTAGIIVSGFILTALGQLAASLLWIAVIYQSVHAWLGESGGVGRFLVWVVAFYIANAPALIARKDAAREADKNVQHVATFVVTRLTLVASFVLLFMPSLLHGNLGWVPHFGQGRGSVEALDSIPDKFLSSRDCLSCAFRAFSNATSLTQVPAGQTSMASTPQHDKKVVNALEEGLRAGHSVGADFLDWLHPQMRDFFEGQYLAGQALYLEGLQQEDLQKQMRGNELIRGWHTKFWDDHKKLIAAKAFPE